MKYFFDNNLSFRFAEMLVALGEDVTALRHEFDEEIEDVELLEELAGSEYVFCTCDRKIQTRRLEAVALRRANVTALFFGPFFSKKGFWDQAAWLVARWPRIDGFAKGVAAGTCAEIKQNGKALVFQ